MPKPEDGRGTHFTMSKVTSSRCATRSSPTLSSLRFRCTRKGMCLLVDRVHSCRPRIGCSSPLAAIKVALTSCKKVYVHVMTETDQVLLIVTLVVVVVAVVVLIALLWMSYRKRYAQQQHKLR